VAIASGASASLAIANSGSIIGAITSGDLDDTFNNAAGANWLAVGTSNFGAGNDLIVNHGTIAMNDANVGLGAGSNAFDNFGTIIAMGDNTIEMAQPFRNNGVVEFRDGAPDDVLTIVGDFAGQGTINLDVSALHKTSDHLYVGGVVNGSTSQTINVDLSTLPGAPTVDIPLAFVGGNIEAGKFTLGNVRYVPYDFLTIDFSLKSEAGATAAARDVLSLALEVTGVNDTGSTAAALAPGAQSLLNAQIGTWRQRMGVVPQKGGDVGVAPWVRYFTQSGDVDPSHGGNFGTGGDFGFHQSNSGWELGVDTRIGEQFAVGVLLAQSEGSQRLTDGAGSDRLDGDGYGVYGTWMANAFYVDASMRWLDIDARLRYPAGELKADASATAFNVEAGFTGWSFSGINLVPQAQYTHTDVDDFSPLVAEQATFVHHGGTSSVGRLGMALDKSFDASNWVLTPYGSLNAIREFDGEFDYTVNGGVQGSTSTEGTSAMVELGLGARTGGLSITGGANWTDGGAMQSVTGGQLVVRYDW
jgi:outer membrane autotransporter protein